MTTPVTATQSHAPQHSAAPNPRRGAAGIAGVVMLVFLQLLIVGAIITGTREQDTSIQRLDAVRAFYAAEGGINMAVREFMAGGGAGADYDGDSVIGSISDNASDGDDPALGSARFAVSRLTLASQTYDITSNALSGSARSRILARVALDLAGGRRVIYGQWSNTFPQYRIWTGTQWGPPRNTLDFGAKLYWTAIRRCPIRTEVAAVCSLQSGDLKAAVQPGMNWGNLITLTNDCGTTDSRPFSLAYEQNSGEALVVYRRQNQHQINYRTWNGTAWSAESSFNAGLSGRAYFMRLVPRRNSNQILCYVIDNNKDIAAMIWDGSAFTNAITLETNYQKVAVNVDNECIDAAFEAQSGRGIVVWGREGDTQPQYRIWDGSAWQSQAALPALSDVPVWPRLAADRASNKLIFGALDLSGRISVNVWSGSSWGSTFQIEASAATLGSRCFDVAFEPSGTRALVMWSRGALLQPRYRVFNGSTWSADSAAPAISSVSYLVQMIPSRNGSEIMIAHNERSGQNALQFMRWDGTDLVNLQRLEENLSGPVGAEVFMIPDDPEGIIDPLRVWSWAPQAP